MSTPLMLKLMPFLKGSIERWFDSSIVKNISFLSNYLTIQPSNWHRRRQGFTLIELLIVITIIGILATLILASFGAAQAKARDARRKSDLAQLKRAMEIAKSDCQGSAYYPHLGGSGAGAFNSLIAYLSSPNLKYISSSLKDPVNNGVQVYAFA